MITVKVTGLAELERALAEASKEIPRAARNALNDTARAVQKDFRATLGGKFEIRRKAFVERQVYFGPDDKATKEKLEARLRIQGPAGKKSTLAKFEDDGVKQARAGHRLAIPSHEIRTRGGHVKPGHQLAKFLPIATLGGSYTKLRKRKGKLTASKSLRSGLRQVGQRGSFIVNLKSGHEALARRRRGTKRGLELLYVFKPSTPIPRSLEFENDARKSAYKWMPVKLGEAVEHALRRANLK